MAEQAKNTMKTKIKAEKRKLAGRLSLPSTSAVTLPATRFDKQASKNIILEVASILVSKKLIFGNMGRKRFCEAYKEQFPNLGVSSGDSADEKSTNDESPTKAETVIPGNSQTNFIKDNAETMNIRTNSTDQNPPNTSGTPGQKPESTTKTMAEPEKEIVTPTNERSKNKDDISGFLNDTSANAIRNENTQTCLDDTEIIQMEENNSWEEGTLLSSSKLQNESDASSSVVNPVSSGSEHEKSLDKNENPKKSISPAATLNPPHSLPTNTARNGVEEGKSTENLQGHDVTEQTILRNQHSEGEKSTPTAGGSKALHPLKGLTEDEKVSWLESIESLNTDAITVSKPGSRGARYAMAKKDLNPGDFISHLRGRVLEESFAKNIMKSTSNEEFFFRLGRLHGNKYIDTRMNKEWPARFISINHLEGNCDIMELEKGPKTYYCIYAKNFIKKGSNLVFCSRK